MLKKLFIAAWIFGILFPMAWFSQRIPGFDRLFITMFASDWAHIAMHAFLYAVLAYAVALLIGWDRARILPILAVVLATGIAQEILQPLPAGILPSQAALFDLLVDLMGGMAGWAFFTAMKRRKGQGVLTELFPRRNHQ